MNVAAIKDTNMPFIFVTGARGTGKTYGELKSLIQSGEPFIVMRRTKTEVDFLARDESTNPFNQLNTDMGWNIGIERASQYIYRIVDRVFDGEGGYTVVRNCGIMLALSTVANIRGFDGSAYTEMFFDEFIPERHARPIKDEHLAFLNAVETIGRNRELQGKPPLRVVCMSNSNRLDNAIYLGLNLVRKVDQMKKAHQMVSVMPERGICLINMEDSPISGRKSTSSLYRMAAGTGFEDMALKNKYIGESENGKQFRHVNLKEYKSLAVIGEICLYQHKTRREWYICSTISGAPARYEMTTADITRFKRVFGYAYLRYLDNTLYFDDRMSELLFTNLFK